MSNIAFSSIFLALPILAYSDPDLASVNGFDKNSVAQEEVQWRRVVEMGFAVFDQ